MVILFRYGFGDFLLMCLGEPYHELGKTEKERKGHCRRLMKPSQLQISVVPFFFHEDIRLTHPVHTNAKNQELHTDSIVPSRPALRFTPMFRFKSESPTDSAECTARMPNL